ncbi:ATP synthase F1 subunit epsilon [Candidatus Saccharibacteria bacterium]|jgi:F-type H+-transporting ATPase subunit epsilon|nr:ATP synthase F1 subunit epsilon [Candidatus Saccharibacteria bacterium]
MLAKVLTISGQKYSGQAREIRLRTTEGDMAILPGHEPFMAIIEPGALTVIDEKGKDDIFSVYGGVVTVEEGSEVKVLVDEADHIDDLIEAEIEEAMKLAEELKSSAKDRQSLYQAQKLIDRHVVRLNVAKIRRRSKR